MKTEMALKLKMLLDNMSQAEFDKKWMEIENLNLEGPLVEDILKIIQVQEE